MLYQFIWTVHINNMINGKCCCCCNSVAKSCPLFVTQWTAVCQVPLSSTICQSLLKFMSIESVILSNHLILCCPLLLLPLIFPSIRVFSNESVLTTGGQSIGALASASVLPMSIQGWFPLGLTGLISLKSKELSGVLWYLWTYSEGTQPYICMYPFSPKPPSHPGCHTTPSRVPCAVQHDLVGDLF